MREHLLKVREDAIVDVVNQLLAEKGYDLMTVDEVAANAGMSKASLYTHFRSKEELAAVAMVRVLDRALTHAQSAAVVALNAPIDKLRAVVRWTLEVQLAGAMPSLPAQNSTLRTYLANHAEFNRMLFELSDLLATWIEASQENGSLTRAVPPEVILYSVYARACDQVLSVLRGGGQYSHEQVIQWVMETSFFGLSARDDRLPKPATAAPARRAAVAKRPSKVTAKASVNPVV
jgi:TetR/AcrR family transcriptional regulator, regulator of autoinduction and epiphytic fitness